MKTNRGNWSYKKAFDEELNKMRDEAASQYGKLKKSTYKADKIVEDTIKKNLDQQSKRKYIP